MALFGIFVAIVHASYKKLLYKKRVLDRSKNEETLVLCSRKINKLCNISLLKQEYIYLLLHTLIIL